MKYNIISPSILLIVCWLFFISVSFLGLLHYDVVLSSKSALDIVLFAFVWYVAHLITRNIKILPKNYDVESYNDFFVYIGLLGIFGCFAFTVSIVQTLGIESFSSFGSIREAALYNAQQHGILHYIGLFMSPLAFISMSSILTKMRPLQRHETILLSVLIASVMAISLVQGGRINLVVVMILLSIRVQILLILGKLKLKWLLMGMPLVAILLLLVFYVGYIRFATGTTEDYYKLQFNAEKRYSSGILGGGEFENYAYYVNSYFAHSIPNYTWLREIDADMPIAYGGLQLSLIGRRLNRFGMPDPEEVTNTVKDVIRSHGRLPNTWFTALREFRVDFGVYWWICVFALGTVSSLSSRYFYERITARLVYCWVAVFIIFSPMFSLLVDTSIQLWLVYSIMLGFFMESSVSSVKKPNKIYNNKK